MCSSDLVLKASKVEFKRGGDDDGSGGTDGGSTEVEITSAVTSIDRAANTLVLKKGAQRVDYGSATLKDGLTEAAIVVGSQLEVKGVLSADGTTVVASEIKLDD